MNEKNGQQMGQPIERLRREMHRALDTIDLQLARLEILTAAMVAFNRPVPEYEPAFVHQRHITASALVLRNPRS